MRSSDFVYEKAFIKSIVRHLKINWRKSHIGVATYGNRVHLRMSLKKHFTLREALRAVSGINYPQETGRRVYGATTTSLGLFCNFFARKILVMIVDAKQLRVSRSLLRRLRSQLGLHGVKLFLAVVGLSDARVMNRYLQSTVHRAERNLFLFAVPWFSDLVAEVPRMARVIRKKTVCYLLYVIFLHAV